MKAIEEEGRASALEADIRHAALLKRLPMEALTLWPLYASRPRQSQ
jgi:hypothetical protein